MTRIEINRLMKKLIFYRQNQLYKTYPIAVGRPETPTPLGEFKIYEKTKASSGAWYTLDGFYLSAPWHSRHIQSLDNQHRCHRRLCTHVQ